MPPASDQDVALMRTAIEALSAIIPTSPTPDQDTKRDDTDQMSSAVEAPPAVTQTPPSSEKDAEQEYLDPMRNVSKAISATTSASPAFERNAEEDNSVRKTNTTGTSSAVTSTPPAPGRVAEKEHLSPMPSSPRQTAESDCMACGTLSHPGDPVESLKATCREKDKSWAERGYSRMKNFVYDRMTTAEVVRQLAKG